MIEAAKTTASAGEIWTICVVALACLGFWLSMVAWADRHPRWRGRQVSEMPGPVLGGMHVAGGGRSVAPNRDAPPVLTGDELAGSEQAEAAATPGTGRPQVPGQREPAQAPPAQAPPAQAPPAQAAPAQADAVPGMPAQRTGDADQPEPSVTRPGSAGQGDDES